MQTLTHTHTHTHKCRHTLTHTLTILHRQTHTHTPLSHTFNTCPYRHGKTVLLQFTFDKVYRFTSERKDFVIRKSVRQAIYFLFILNTLFLRLCSFRFVPSFLRLYKSYNNIHNRAHIDRPIRLPHTSTHALYPLTQESSSSYTVRSLIFNIL